ncbi:MAG: hypothetical protein Q9201_007180 [Fulgogasparrea decipioides]
MASASDFNISADATAEDAILGHNYIQCILMVHDKCFVYLRTYSEFLKPVHHAFPDFGLFWEKHPEYFIKATDSHLEGLLAAMSKLQIGSKEDHGAADPMPHNLDHAAAGPSHANKVGINLPGAASTPHTGDRLTILHKEFVTLLRETREKGNRAADTWIGYSKWAEKHNAEVKELQDFEKTKRSHLKAIVDLKKHIETSSRDLGTLTRKHMDQHPGNEEAKKEAMSQTAATDLGKDILANATVYSTVKKGHERWGPIVAQKTKAYLEDGAKLQRLTIYEPQLKAKIENHGVGMHKRLVSWKKLSKEFDVMRLKLANLAEEIDELEGHNGIISAAKMIVSDIHEYWEENKALGHAEAFNAVVEAWDMHAVEAEAGHALRMKGVQINDELAALAIEGEGEATDIKGKGKATDIKGKGKATDIKGKGEATDIKGEEEATDIKGKGKATDSKAKGKASDIKGKGKAKE